MKNIIKIFTLTIILSITNTAFAFNTFITPESKVVKTGETFPVKLFITPTDDSYLPFYDIKGVSVFADVSKNGIIEFKKFEPTPNLSMRAEPVFYSDQIILPLHYTGDPIVSKTAIEIGTLYIKAKEVGNLKLYIHQTDIDTHTRYYNHFIEGHRGVNTKKSIFAIKLRNINIVQPTGTTGIKQVGFIPNNTADSAGSGLTPPPRIVAPQGNSTHQTETTTTDENTPTQEEQDTERGAQITPNNNPGENSLNSVGAHNIDGDEQKEGMYPENHTKSNEFNYNLIFAILGAGILLALILLLVRRK